MGEFTDRVRTDPRIHGGRAHILGSRLSIDQVVRLFHAGIAREEIARLCGPDITVQDIDLAIRYHGLRFTRTPTEH